MFDHVPIFICRDSDAWSSILLQSSNNRWQRAHGSYFFWNSKIVSVITGKIGIPCGMRHHREISVSHILRWNSIADGVEAGRM